MEQSHNPPDSEFYFCSVMNHRDMDILKKLKLLIELDSSYPHLEQAANT